MIHTVTQCLFLVSAFSVPTFSTSPSITAVIFQVDLSGKEYRFKSKIKHWDPTKTHHKIDTFIEATKEDSNEQLTKTIDHYQMNQQK